MNLLKIFWLFVLGFMFIFSRYWGDAQDTIFWGVTLIVALIYDVSMIR